MDIKHTVFKRKTGDGKRYAKPWTLRFVFQNEVGKRCAKTYQFATKVEANDSKAKLEHELRQTQGMSSVGGKMTFYDLAELAKKTFYAPAQIVQGRKVSGIKSHRQTCVLIDSLVDYIGKKKLANITRSDMDGYKTWRLKRGDLRGNQLEQKEISISTVNRGLAIFKRMMKHAFAEGWILRDITVGSKAIDSDAEKPRTRLLNASEEMRLLASCDGERTITYSRKGKVITTSTTANNPFLKTVILFALDAGFRKNEILTLDWSDVDFDNALISVQSQHTKTQRARKVPLTERLRQSLESLPNFSTSGKIFNFSDFKRSWGTALRQAGIEDLNFRDLRRTFVTKLNRNDVPIAIASKLAGHSSLSTTQKHYVSIDDQSILDGVKEKLDAAGGKVEQDAEILH